MANAHRDSQGLVVLLFALNFLFIRQNFPRVLIFLWVFEGASFLPCTITPRPSGVRRSFSLFLSRIRTLRKAVPEVFASQGALVFSAVDAPCSTKRARACTEQAVALRSRAVPPSTSITCKWRDGVKLTPLATTLPRDLGQKATSGRTGALSTDIE